MKGFRERLRAAIERSPYGKDIWRLSLDAGMSKKTVWNILNDERLDVSQAGPGLFGMARVAALINTSLDHLAGIAPAMSPTGAQIECSDPLANHAARAISGQQMQAGELPTADGLLRIFLKSGGMLKAFDDHLDFCDQYGPCTPSDTGLKVISVGAKSLSAITMGQASRDLLQTALDTAPSEELKARWVEAYSNALESGPVVTLETLDVQMSNHPVRVKMDFVRALLPVDDGEGNLRILNFSLLVV